MEQEPQYLPISPLILFPSMSRDFSLFTKRGDSYCLYCRKDEPFTKEHKDILHERGVNQVYVDVPGQDWFKNYAQSELGRILQNPKIPLAERGSAFYSTSLAVVQKTFTSKMPDGLDPYMIEGIRQLVHDSLTFLSREETLRTLGQLMSHDFDTYAHSVNVFVLSSAILRGLGGFDTEKLVRIGVGAILHDIGKTELPESILNKPGPLTAEEFRQVRCHPLMGHQMCSGADLSQESHEVILYHHEKMDGSGYPRGLKANQIPFFVRAVTIVDIYDALTSKRPYAAPLAPFDALNLMRREFDGKIDPEMYERFVKLLSCNL